MDKVTSCLPEAGLYQSASLAVLPGALQWAHSSGLAERWLSGMNELTMSLTVVWESNPISVHLLKPREGEKKPGWHVVLFH